MTRPKAILLGVATTWPPLYMLLFMGFFMYLMLTLASHVQPPEQLVFVVFPLHMLTMLVMFSLLPLYIYLVMKKADFDTNNRMLWVLLFVTAGIVTMPVYWFLHIWKKSLGSPPVLDEAMGKAEPS